MGSTWGRWTYSDNYAAHYVDRKQPDVDRIVTVPDQVAHDQRGFAERDQAFPALLAGRKIWMHVDAEATGLFTAGTGDLVVRRAPTHGGRP